MITRAQRARSAASGATRRRRTRHDTNGSQQSNRSAIRMIEMVQQCQLLDIENMKSVLEAKGASQAILKYAYITHDKDKNASGENVAPHIHCVMKFGYATRIGAIQNWFKIESNSLQKIRSSWVTACRYLTHMNHPDKYQYDPKDVVANFDYDAECKIGNTKLTKRGKTIPPHIMKKLERITSGEIVLKNIHKCFTVSEYSTYKKTIMDYLEFTEIQRLETLREKKQMMENIFVYGESGIGKTRYAKMYCEDKHKEYFLSGSSNDPLDGYKGEKAIIFDDLRPEEVLFSDYLRLTDPFSVCAYRSRYKNKTIEAETQMITTPLSPHTYASRMKKDGNENLKQFFRRHQTYIKVLKETLEFYGYDEEFDALVLKANEVNFANPRVACRAKTSFAATDEVIERSRKLSKTALSEYTQSTATGMTEIDELEDIVIEECHHMVTPRVDDNPIDDLQ